MDGNKEKFIQLIQHPFKFRLFLLYKLPSAFFSGVRVKSIDETKILVTIPYKWFSQNPFKSTYFACLAMAAEMSTGLLAMMHTYNQMPEISMLVVGMEARYFKKATTVTTFSCEDGNEIKNAIHIAKNNAEGSSFKATSLGRNEKGELVAEFLITWSFKVKKKNPAII